MSPQDGFSWSIATRVMPSSSAGRARFDQIASGTALVCENQRKDHCMTPCRLLGQAQGRSHGETARDRRTKHVQNAKGGPFAIWASISGHQNQRSARTMYKVSPGRNGNRLAH